MKTTVKERLEVMRQLKSLGFTYQEALVLRRISMTLRSWAAKECGINNGCIERDEKTNKPYWLSSQSMVRYPIADRETGALNRLKKIMKNHSTLSFYHQPDPRGAALYILRPGDVPEGSQAENCYTNGIVVY